MFSAVSRRARVGGEAFEKLTDNDRKLLGIPYYLNIALQSGSPQLGSAAKAIEGYFLNQVKLDNTELVTLSNVAFNALLKEKSSSFEAATFSDSVGEEIHDRLQGSGAIKIVPDGFIQFEHQLHQDYLLSKCLSSDSNTWNANSFDAVSFDSQSVESLEMVLEQLPNFEKGDEFLTCLYDWNWGATVQCLANAAQSGIKNYSHEMESVVLAVVAEKLLDPIERTRERAVDRLSLFVDPAVEKLLEAAALEQLKLQDIFSEVYKVNSQKTEFLEWRELFTRTPEDPITETEIKTIASANPVLGWTASNVIRRFSLTEDDLRQLRGIYDGASSNGGNSVRWRVVHALGRAPTNENVALLLNALSSKDKWVRYGAVRSLVEVAALTKSEELREKVIEQLTSLADSLDASAQREICNAVFYRDSPPTWRILVIPLLKRIRDAQSTESDRERLERTLEMFELVNKKERV